MGKFKRLMPYDEALSALVDALPLLSSERVPVSEALGRILSDDVRSTSDSPPFDRAAMDGYAVIAADTAGAGATLEVIDSVTAGDVSSRPVSRGQAVRVMTGAMMPPGADAVLMQEYAGVLDGCISPKKAISPGTHISWKGEDIASGQTVLPRGTVLGPEHVALLASLTIPEVPCHIMPSVAILATGDELADPGDDVPQGHIVDTNSGMLSALAERCGCRVVLRKTVPDDKDALASALAEAGEAADMVLVTGGSSFGDKDYVQEVLGELTFHGVAIKPGKPFGVSAGDRTVFMMSGYPVAAFMQMYLFFIPCIEHLTGATLLRRVSLPMGEQIPSSLGRAEVIRASVADGRIVPLHLSGSSRLSSVAWADGFVLSPSREEGINEGDRLVFTYFL